MAHAARQIDQVRRRVLEGQVIAHEEKVFSIFESHTEWVSKGKAGVPVELGVKVCILEDQHQFILHHQVMQRQSDDQVCVQMVVQAKNRFPKLNAPMATSNSPTFGQSNSSRQDGRIISRLMCPWPCALRPP